MKVTRRQLQRIIREEREILTERQKFENMLNEESEMGTMMKMAFQALKSAGEKVGPMLTQWLKSNPDILEDLIGKFIEDEKIKDVLLKQVEKIKPEEDTTAAAAGPA